VYAVENHVERLQVDHDNAQILAKEIEKIPGLRLDQAGVHSNLVFFEVDPKLGNASQLSYALKQQGVLMNASGPARLRAVTHLDVSRDDVVTAMRVLKDCVTAGFSAFPGAPSGPYARG
jgi:threonine aldolase